MEILVAARTTSILRATPKRFKLALIRGTLLYSLLQVILLTVIGCSMPMALI